MAVHPKYRRLSKVELQELEKEFVEYLIINGIAADDWERLKQEELGKAEDIITLFSDVVFEGILRKVKFLDYYSAYEVKSIQCLADKMVLVGMHSSDPKHDFTDADFIKEASIHAPGGLEVYSSEKEYIKKREEELFELLKGGAIISKDGKLFKALSLSMVK